VDLRVDTGMGVHFRSRAAYHNGLRSSFGGVMRVSVMVVRMASYLLGLSRRNIATAPAFLFSMAPSRRFAMSAAEVVVVAVIIAVMVTIMAPRACIVAVMIAIAMLYPMIIPIMISVVLMFFRECRAGGKRHAKQDYQSHQKSFHHCSPCWSCILP